MDYSGHTRGDGYSEVLDHPRNAVDHMSYYAKEATQVIVRRRIAMWQFVGDIINQLDGCGVTRGGYLRQGSEWATHIRCSFEKPMKLQPDVILRGNGLEVDKADVERRSISYVVTRDHPVDVVNLGLRIITNTKLSTFDGGLINRTAARFRNAEYVIVP
jgi:hypothetical protein